MNTLFSLQASPGRPMPAAVHLFVATRRSLCAFLSTLATFNRLQYAGALFAVLFTLTQVPAATAHGQMHPPGETPLYSAEAHTPNAETRTHVTQNDALQQAMELRDAFRDEEALAAFKQVLRTDRRNYKALYNVVLINTSLGLRESRAADEQARYNEAHEYAQQLLAAYPDSADAYFAYAAAIGRVAQSAGARDRVRMSTEIREHAEKAVELDPQHARAWNVLGVWHHRAANLSRLERLAANALFGGAPVGASNDSARAAFERAMAIDSDFVLYYHDKAEFLITIGETAEARRVISQGLRLADRTSDDQRWKANMREMQGRL